MTYPSHPAARRFLWHLPVLLPLLIAAVLCVVPTQAIGQAVDCIVSSSPESSNDSSSALPRCEQLHPPGQTVSAQSNWSLGATVGYGERDNPLINANADAIYGFVHIAYFGERFFFDNGDFGWSLNAGDEWSLNLIAGVGGERSFFSFFDDGGGFAPDLNFGAQPGLPQDLSPEQREAIATPDRDRTIDGGLELIANWHKSEIMVQLLTDISDKHNGQEAWLSWARPINKGRWDVVPSAGLVWKSKKNTDYYFGIRPDEVQTGLSQYSAGQSINPFLRLSLTYSLNSHWKIVSLLRYERLHSEITDSPMVEDDSVTTAFVGLHYAF